MSAVAAVIRRDQRRHGVFLAAARGDSEDEDAEREQPA